MIELALSSWRIIYNMNNNLRDRNFMGQSYIILWHSESMKNIQKSMIFYDGARDISCKDIQRRIITLISKYLKKKINIVTWVH